VEQGGGDPLVPSAAFIEQVFIEPDDSPHFQHVLRRDPAFGQVPGQQVDPQVPGIGLVGFGVPLAAAQRGGVRRLGQMRLGPRGQQLLHDIPPAGAALQREMHVVLAGEPGQPIAQMLPVGRGDPAAAQLPGHGVEILEGQLAAVHVECAYDAHEGPPRAPAKELGQGTWFPKPDLVS
jgi:hypothetical protein